MRSSIPSSFASMFCARSSRDRRWADFLGTRKAVYRPKQRGLAMASSTSQTGSHPVPLSGSKDPYVPVRLASFRRTAALRLESRGRRHTRSLLGSIETSTTDKSGEAVILSGNLDLAMGSNACTPCWPSRFRAPRNRSAFDAAGWVAALDIVENVRAKADILLDVQMQCPDCWAGAVR
jgi:hypothetical protein